MNLVVLGLTVTSTWGNGHATTYRALLGALARRGHHVTFLERDLPWYRDNRDEPHPDGIDVRLYHDLAGLRDRHLRLVRDADVVVVGSFVPDGKQVAAWVLDEANGTRAFYDIDTPATLRALEDGTCQYVDADLLGRFDVVFSFASGEAIRRLHDEFDVPRAVPLPCAVDAQRYAPRVNTIRYALGYLGTYSADRQGALERLLNATARRRPDRRFAVAGPQYPNDLDWPPNVDLLGHLPQPRHVDFYTQQRFTLNVTRQAMVEHGHAPSVRLFEAAATATPVISDAWHGLDESFRVGSEVLVAHTTDDVLAYLEMPEPERRDLGKRARRRVLRDHTAEGRAATFEEALGVLVGV